MKNLTTICTIILVMIITGCSKYEEGGFSLRSKKGRLVNKWKVEEALHNGNIMGIQGQPLSDLDIWIEFKKDGTYNLYNGGSGTWEFDESKEYIYLNSNDDQGFLGDIMKIIKLKNDELKVEFSEPQANIQPESDDDLWETHFKSYD